MSAEQGLELGFLAKRKLDRTLGPDRLVLKATAGQVVRVVQSAAQVIERPVRFSKTTRWLPHVAWSKDPQAGQVAVFHRMYNTKKQKAGLPTFTVDVNWNMVDAEHIAITIATSQATAIDDRLEEHKDHEKLRHELLVRISELDPGFQLVESRYA